MIRLYNTLTREKEELKPIKEGEVGLYSCGPTVYWFAHIGNLRAFVFADILRRTIEVSGLKVKKIMNITDVGHLTDDADAGEDKMLVAMQKEGKTALEIAEFYTDQFQRDIARLNIKEADAYPKATEHIQEQIDMIKQLEENGFTYKTSDGVYFDTSKLDDYGKLSRQSAEEKQAGARVEMGEKKNATDFALWKFSPEGVKREMEWESPWGTGFPGWHIECSAMSAKYLGVPFDIHTGGVDHIPVHHENELAQTKGALGVLQANVWMHNEFITVDDGKMSKSLGNLYTLDDLREHGFGSLSYRYFCLTAHYRSKLNFTWASLQAAHNALQKLRATVRSWEQPEGGVPELEEKFMAAMNDDLNTPNALAVVWELVDSAHPSSAKAASLLKMDEVLGLELVDYVAIPLEVPANVQKLVDAREAARKDQDFNKSDELREQINELGYDVEDGPEGPTIREK